MTVASSRKSTEDEAKRLDSILLPFQEATQYVADHHAELLDAYPEQWIAVKGNEVLAASPRRDLIGRRLKKLGRERNRVYVTFLTKKRQTLIL
jgi:hypothetical protein